MYPKLYSNISRHTGPPPVDGSVGVLLAVGHHILRSDPTWGKVNIRVEPEITTILMVQFKTQFSKTLLGIKHRIQPWATIL